MTGTSAGARGRALVVRSLLPGRRLGFALVVSVLATTVLPVLAPQFTLRFVDDAMTGASTGHLVLVAVGYLSLAIAALAARTVTGWLANGLAWDGTNRLRERLAEHALALDLEYHGKHPPGELIERVDGDVAAVADFAVAFLLDVVVNVLLLAAIVVGVFLVDVRLGAVLTGYCLVVFLAMARGQRWAVPSATRSRAASAALYGELEESLAGAEDLRANGAGEHMLSRFHRTSAAWYHAEYRAARIGVAVMAGVSVAFAGGTAVVLGSAAWLLNAGALTVGTAVLLLQYTLLLRAPFERLIDQLRAYQGRWPASPGSPTCSATSRCCPSRSTRGSYRPPARCRHGWTGCRSPTLVATDRRCSMWISSWRRASRSDWSGGPAAARRRSRGCCCGCTTRTRGRCASAGSTCGTSTARRCAGGPAW